jgi:hypothetical protein
MKLFFWQIDQDHTRIFAQSVKHNLFAVWRDVEGSRGRAVFQPA